MESGHASDGKQGSVSDRQGKIGGSPMTGDTAGAAAGQPAQVHGQETDGSVSGQGSGMQPQAGDTYMQPQAEGNYMPSPAAGNSVQPQAEGNYAQPQAPGAGNYMQ